MTAEEPGNGFIHVVVSGRGKNLRVTGEGTWGWGEVIVLAGANVLGKFDWLSWIG